jgi:hypothetical protein
MDSSEEANLIYKSITPFKEKFLEFFTKKKKSVSTSFKSIKNKIVDENYIQNIGKNKFLK